MHLLSFVWAERFGLLGVVAVLQKAGVFTLRSVIARSCACGCLRVSPWLRLAVVLTLQSGSGNAHTAAHEGRQSADAHPRTDADGITDTLH